MFWMKFNYMVLKLRKDAGAACHRRGVSIATEWFLLSAGHEMLQACQEVKHGYAS